MTLNLYEHAIIKELLDKDIEERIKELEAKTNNEQRLYGEMMTLIARKRSLRHHSTKKARTEAHKAWYSAYCESENAEWEIDNRRILRDKLINSHRYLKSARIETRRANNKTQSNIECILR